VATSRPLDEPSADAWARYRSWALARLETPAGPAGDSFPLGTTFVMPYVEVLDGPGDRRRSADGLGDEDLGGAVVRAAGTRRKTSVTRRSSNSGNSGTAPPLM
jgi:hypothetical protein